MPSIAVVGAGVSGLSAAYILHRAGHEVALYEAEPRCGGHAWTVGEGPAAVDIGFQVFNLTTYPNLVALFRELEVDTEESAMTFSNSAGRWEWSSEGLGTVFPSLGSYFDWAHVAMVLDIFKFGRHAPTVLRDPQYEGMTMQTYLRRHGYSPRFMTGYIGPMLAAIWSVPGSTALDMPIRSVVQFYLNHHLLSTVSPRPTWRVVTGRSRTYVDAILAHLPDVKTAAEIVTAVRDDTGVTLTDRDGREYRHDQVIFATHAPDTLRILGADARAEERSILEAVRYQDNLCVLHNDPSFMPKDTNVWAAWNFIGQWRGPEAPDAPKATEEAEPSVCCTYWLNRLQNLPEGVGHRFVTLNPHRPVPPTAILGQWTLAHPVLDAGAVQSQERLAEVQGRWRTWFAGAWTRYGFHEDGVLSAVVVTARMGVPVPWKATFTPDPVPTSSAYMALRLFNTFAGSAIQTGHLRLLLPDGTERRYGDAASSLKAVVRVLDWQFFTKLASGSDIALGEAYMADMFDADGDVSKFADVLIANQNNFVKKLWMLGPINYAVETLNWLHHLALVRNTIGLASANIKAHYDQGNDMFRSFLDASMMYSSAIHWDDDAEEEEWLWGSKRYSPMQTEQSDGLYEAQMRKLDVILKAAEIPPGGTVLEIGCGWGECAIRAVTQYQCKWVGITLAEEQKAEADARVLRLGLQDRIDIRVVDYRHVLDHYPAGSFDAIVSIEMMEALGHANIPSFFQTAHRALKPGGKLMVQVITIPHDRYDAYCKSSDFIRKHIFPGGHLPSVEVLQENCDKVGLRLDHCRDIGPHYTVTLREWRRRFLERYDHVLKLGYDRPFFRKFVWYFAICESSFRAKMIGDHHLRWVKDDLLSDSAKALRSGLYVGTVLHARKQVKGLSKTKHSFSYPVMMAYLNLAEVDRVFKGRWFWGVNRRAPIAFHRADHFGPKDRPLEACVRDEVQKKLGTRPTGPITMLTHLRYMGYCFNPITVYYCWASGGHVVDQVVLHVTNTPWQEDVLYVLPVQDQRDEKGRLIADFTKELHVSPFLSMDYLYRLIADTPGHRIDLAMENYPKQAPENTSKDLTGPLFRASVHLTRREITTASLARFLVTVPLLTWQVQLWIHWQALLLLFKRATVFEVPHEGYTVLGSNTARTAFDSLKHLFLFAGALTWAVPERLFRLLGL